MDLLDALLVVGLAARLTRLAVDDRVGRPFRDATRTIGRKVAGDDGLVWADELVTCPWCVGFWISAATVVSYVAWGDHGAWTLTAAVFTVSYAVGLLAARED